MEESVISAGGFSTNVESNAKVAEKTRNLVAFIANPDLPKKLKNNLPLNKYDKSIFYTHEVTGYKQLSYS